MIKKRIRWSEYDINILKEYYSKGESTECYKHLEFKRSFKSISKKANEIGLFSEKWNLWTNDEIELLKVKWKSATMNDLLSSFPNKTYSILMTKAGELKIKSEASRRRIGSVDFLDTLNINSCYWWGFIMADGYINDIGVLAITLSSKDKIHLEKLSKILGCNLMLHTKKASKYSGENSSYCTLRIQDKNIIKKWASIFGLVNNKTKTYFPPNLSIFINKEYLVNFMIGFIDGDGCIWKTEKANGKNKWINLRIEIHANWLNTLELISKKLKEFYEIDSKVKVGKKGYARLEINTKNSLKILYDYSTNLDCMERKWEKLKGWG